MKSDLIATITPYLKLAQEGERIEPGVFVDFFSKYDELILWGVGNLGKALGEKLSGLGVNIAAYWDTNFENIDSYMGVSVYAPFSYGEKGSSLVLFCIGNVAVGPNIYRQLEQNGWNDVIHGNDILQALLCPLDNSKPADTAVCNSFDVCSVCSCQRLHSIVNANVARKEGISVENTLTFDRIHFITNNICNLKCTHCFIYVNSYPKERKKNVDIEQIVQDINITLSAIHSFGVINIFGGEPFLHKQLNTIVSQVLSHDNFGSVIVNTNGLVKFKDKQLQPLKDKRVRLAFSNYLEVIDGDKEKVFFENIEFAKRIGINTKYQNTLPTWNVSSTLEVKGDNEAEMAKKKLLCGVKYLYVFDGKIFPCAFTMSIYDLGIEDYPSDYITLDPNKTLEKLREEIKAMIERDYYGACGHCETFGSPALTNVAGSQGYDDRYSLPEKKKVIPIAVSQ